MSNNDLYFDDFFVGHKIVSPTRTVTESDIVNFAAYTGDYNLIHTDAEYSKNSLAGQRMAHGMLGLSYAMGLNSRTIFNQQQQKAIIAFYGFTDWKFLKPILIGDTIHVETEIVELIDTKPDRGIVRREMRLINQRGEVVQSGYVAGLIAKRPK